MNNYFIPSIIFGAIGIGTYYWYNSNDSSSKKIFIFFESHSDPAPARTMNELLPFFNKENIKTFCAEQPTTETKESTIQQHLLVEQKMKSVDQKSVTDPYIQEYFRALPAHKEYIKFLNNLSKYSIKFKAVDMPYGSMVAQIKNNEERNKFIANKIVNSYIDNDLLMLIGLHHLEIGCKLKKAGYDVYGYYIPSLSIGEHEYSKLDEYVRPKNKDDHTKIWKAKINCDKEGYFFDFNVIDISINNQLNATNMIIDDYYN